MRLAALMWLGASVIAVAQQQDAGGMHAPTVALERGRTVFVTSSCHFCHGVDLTQTSMGAANLLRSGIVAADVNGNILWPFVKAGLPALQTSMPSYYDMTQQEGTDLAAYVHYLRQMGRYRELIAAPLSDGNAVEGKAAFNKQGSCVGCHTIGSLAPIVKTKTPTALKEDLLLPAIARPKEGVTLDAAAAGHQKFTENASPAEVANLLSYLHELQ
jgi:mono/diheme cytochrome c family protein